MTSELLELEKATNPARLSVQSRATDTALAPMSDVTGAGMFWLGMGSQSGDEAPAWNPIYPHYRDVYLHKFAQSEAMLASAIYSMKTRIATLNYELSGPPRAKKYAAELLNNPGLGDNLATVMQKLMHDMHTSDNGAFMELWRPGNPTSDASNRPVLGFAHLDSRQCWRSYDPEFPVWYTNPVTNEIRKLHFSRVVFQANDPQPIEIGRGIGFCSVSRVLRMTRVFRNMQTFLDEKIGGRFTRAIGSVNGVTPIQLREALNQSESNADSKGFVIYKQIPFLINPSLEAGSEIKVMMQDLASIPDGFIFRDNADIYAYILSFCFGVDAREFWPATASGATKADASIQNMKARGRGIGLDIEVAENFLRAALPESVVFEYDYTDDEQDRQAAEIHKIETDTLKVYFDMGMPYAQIEALAKAKGIIDAEVLENLQTPITSDDNPDTATQAPAESAAPATEPQDESMKSYSDYRSQIRSFVASFWGGTSSAYDFVDNMSYAITRYFTEAWENVEQIYGINSDERTEASQTRLNLAINTEISYLSGFADAIAAGSKANGGALLPLLDRAELWAKGYDRTTQLAQIVVAGNIKFKWVRDPAKDSCIDCVMLDGIIAYKSEWDEAQIYPTSSDLACSGIQCGCRFEPTKERKTRGGIPPIVGRKHLEHHVHTLETFHIPISESQYTLVG